MLGCVHSARLNNFLSFSLSFASGETTGPGNRTDALAHMLSLFLTSDVLPVAHYVPPS